MSLTSMKVMVIEDNPVIREATGAWLASKGHSVRVAPCKIVAVQQLADGWQPDLWLLDLMLPGCPGERILDWVRRTYPRSKVLVTTGIKTRPMPEGVTVLHKPYDYTDDCLGQAISIVFSDNPLLSLRR